jgi:hypothetical protein
MTILALSDISHSLGASIVIVAFFAVGLPALVFGLVAFVAAQGAAERAEDRAARSSRR